jgi:hypothetical protein
MKKIDRFGLTPSKFDVRDVFGGNEAAAYAAIVEHEAKLVPGTYVRIYRGQLEGTVGIIEGIGEGGYRIHVYQGLHVTTQSRNIEIVECGAV